MGHAGICQLRLARSACVVGGIMCCRAWSWRNSYLISMEWKDRPALHYCQEQWDEWEALELDVSPFEAKVCQSIAGITVALREERLDLQPSWYQRDPACRTKAPFCYQLSTGTSKVLLHRLVLSGSRPWSYCYYSIWTCLEDSAGCSQSGTTLPHKGLDHYIL